MLYFLAIGLSAMSSVLHVGQKKVGQISFLLYGIAASGAAIDLTRDIPMYRGSYYGYWKNLESGYTAIAQVAHLNGITFETFRVLVLMLTYILLAYAVSEFTENVAIVSVFYGISSFFVDYIQFRCTMAAALTMLGLVAMKRSEKKYKLLGIIIIGLAATVHSIALVYLIAIILSRLLIARSRTFFVGSTIVCLVIAFFFETKGRAVIQGFLVTIASVLNFRSTLAENLSTVYSQGSSMRMWESFLFVSVIMLALLLSSHAMDEWTKETDTSRYITILTIILTNVCVIFMTVSVDYERILRFSFLMFTILVIDKSSMAASKRIAFVKPIRIIVLILAFLLCIYQMRMYGLTQIDIGESLRWFHY